MSLKYGICVRDDISKHNIGRVFIIENILTEEDGEKICILVQGSFCDAMPLDCVKLIRKESFDLLSFYNVEREEKIKEESEEDFQSWKNSEYVKDLFGE